MESVHPKTLLLSPVSVCREREVNITVVERSQSFSSDTSSVSAESTLSSEAQAAVNTRRHDKAQPFFSGSSRTTSCRTMTRTRMADRLAVAANKSTKNSRSDELDGLRTKFETFSKQFKPFSTALKNYNSSLVALEKNRSEVR